MINKLRKLLGFCVHEQTIIKEGTPVQLPKSQHQHNILHVLKEDLVICKHCHDRLKY